jgi:hypothetical protein
MPEAPLTFRRARADDPLGFVASHEGMKLRLG